MHSQCGGALSEVDMRLELTGEQREIREANWPDFGSLRPQLFALKERDLGFLHCEECGDVEGIISNFIICGTRWM
jgi:hypothetical protein